MRNDGYADERLFAGPIKEPDEPPRKETWNVWRGREFVDQVDAHDEDRAHELAVISFGGEYEDYRIELAG